MLSISVKPFINFEILPIILVIHSSVGIRQYSAGFFTSLSTSNRAILTEKHIYKHLQHNI